MEVHVSVISIPPHPHKDVHSELGIWQGGWAKNWTLLDVVALVGCCCMVLQMCMLLRVVVGCCWLLLANVCLMKQKYQIGGETGGER